MKTEQDICVDRQDRWWAAGQIISNEAILAYFKAHLHFDGQRYFIANRHGNLKEEAYLKAVEGFPLHLLLAHPLDQGCEVSLDGGQRGMVAWSEFFMSDDTTLGAFFQGIPVRLSPLAMAALSTYLEEENDSFILHGNPLPVHSRGKLFPEVEML